jgi:excisionase family DNA binding protein
MNQPEASLLDTVLDALVERIAGRAAEKVLESLRPVLQGARPADAANLLDAKAAAEKLHVPVGAVYKLSASGRLPAVKVGARLRFRVSDLEQFIEQGTRSADRVRALAAAAQAETGMERFGAHRAPASTRGPRVAALASSGKGTRQQATAEPGLKVVTNNDPGTAKSRRTGA